MGLFIGILVLFGVVISSVYLSLLFMLDEVFSETQKRIINEKQKIID